MKTALYLTLHRNTMLAADGWMRISDAQKPDLYGETLRSFHPFEYRDLFRAQLQIEGPDPHEGWISGRMMVDLNGCALGRGTIWQPISFYVGEPTDWDTGLARYADPGWRESPLPEFRRPAVWTLGVRRA